MTPEENNGAAWISIPSIPPGRVGLGALAFFTAVAAAIVIDLLLIRHNHQPPTWQLTAELVFDDGSTIVGWALAATWPIMEAIRMVLAGIYERRNRRRAYADGHADGHSEGRSEGRAEGRSEGRAEGRSEGRSEANSAWRDWLRRKEAAAERGEPFHEPMPDDESDANGGQG